MAEYQDYSYWYFTYEINNKKTGAHIKDDGVIMSIDTFFPINSVLYMCADTFGKEFKFTLLSAVRISKAGYNNFYAENTKFPTEGGYDCDNSQSC